MIFEKLKELFPEGRVYGRADLIVGELGFTICCHSAIKPFERTDIRYKDGDLLPIAEVHQDGGIQIAGMVYSFRIYPSQLPYFKGIAVNNILPAKQIQ